MVLMIGSICSWSELWFALVVTLIAAMESSALGRWREPLFDHLTSLPTILSIAQQIAMAVSFVSAWALVYCHVKSDDQTTSSSSSVIIARKRHLIELLAGACFVLSNSLNFLVKCIVVNHAEEAEDLNTLLVAAPSTMLICLSPLLACFFLSSTITPLKLAIIWLPSLSCLSISVNYLAGHVEASASAVIYYLILSAVLINMVTCRREEALQTQHQRHVDVLLEKEEASQALETEMKHLVANVAHDLKTVSSSSHLLLT
eukprot:scaffold4094_cov201-Ochromonas_danica.AAC.9